MVLTDAGRLCRVQVSFGDDVCINKVENSAFLCTWEQLGRFFRCVCFFLAVFSSTVDYRL